MSILKRFVSYYRPYMAFFLMDIFCAVLLSVIDLSFPQILRWLPEGLFAGDAASILSALKWLLPALLLWYLLRALCQFYVTSYGHIMGTRMETDMRRDLFHKYMELSYLDDKTIAVCYGNFIIAKINIDEQLIISKRIYRR